MLAGTAQDRVKLSPTLFPINETITSRDYIADSSLINYKPMVNSNLNAILQLWPHQAFTLNTFKAFFDSQSNYFSISTADIHFSDVTHSLHFSFLLLLSSISSPFTKLF